MNHHRQVNSENPICHPGVAPRETKTDEGRKENDRSKTAIQLAEELKNDLRARCSLAIDKTREAIQKNARIVDEVLYAIVEHGNDLFIRWPGVRKEYEDLSRTWICEIDPDEFAEVASNDVTYKRCGEATKAVRSALASLAAR